MVTGLPARAWMKPFSDLHYLLVVPFCAVQSLANFFIRNLIYNLSLLSTHHMSLLMRRLWDTCTAQPSSRNVSVFKGEANSQLYSACLVYGVNH